MESQVLYFYVACSWVGVLLVGWSGEVAKEHVSHWRIVLHFTEEVIPELEGKASNLC